MEVRIIKKKALYQVIEDGLKEHLASGQLKVNQKIPTEKELAEQYQVSRATVRQALSSLVTSGQLERIAGKGTFVRPTKKVEHSTKVESFTEEMLRLQKRPSTEVLDFQLTVATAEIAQYLNVPVASQVYYFERLRLADDEALVLECTYMSFPRYDDLSIHHLKTSKYAYVEAKTQQKLAYIHQIMTPIMPTDKISQLLKLDMQQPLIEIKATSYLDNGEIMDYTKLYNHPGKMQLNVIRNRF